MTKQQLLEWLQSKRIKPAPQFPDFDGGYDSAIEEVIEHVQTFPDEPSAPKDESFSVAALRARLADTSMKWSRSHVEGLINKIAELTKQRDEGWDNFYLLRKRVAEERYPGMTTKVYCDNCGHHSSDHMPPNQRCPSDEHARSLGEAIRQCVLRKEPIPQELALAAITYLDPQVNRQAEPTRDAARGACAMANRPSCESYPNCTCGRAVGVVSQSTGPGTLEEMFGASRSSGGLGYDK